MINQISLLEMVLREASGNTTVACGILPGGPGRILALHNARAAQVGTAIVSEAGKTFQKLSGEEHALSRLTPRRRYVPRRHLYFDYHRANQISYLSLHVPH